MIFFILAQIVAWVCNIFIIMLLIRTVLSWVVFSGYRYNRTFGRLYDIFTALTEPVVAPVRRLIRRFVNTGYFDFSPLLTFFIVILVSRILRTILIGLID